MSKASDHSLKSETCEDEGDGSEGVPNGDLCSFHGMHEGSDPGFQVNVDLNSTQHGNISMCTDPREVHDNEHPQNAPGETDLPISPPLPAPAPAAHAHHFVKSMATSVAFHKHGPSTALLVSGEQNYEGLSSHATSGMPPTKLAAKSELDHHQKVAYETSHGHVHAAASCNRPVDFPPDAHCNGRQELSDESLCLRSKDHVLLSGVADADMLKTPSTCHVSGSSACQDYIAGTHSHFLGMHAGKPPIETLPLNRSAGDFEEERQSNHSSPSNSSALQPTVVGDKEGLTESACKDTHENWDFRGNMSNNKTSNNETQAHVHEKPFAYNKPIVDDLHVSIEHPEFTSQDPGFSAKIGSNFTGSSYYTSQSSYMKNLAHILRFGGAIFSLIAFSVMISNNEKRVAAGSTFHVRFSDFQAYNYLAALNLFTFLYSIGHLVLHLQEKTGCILSSRVKWGASIYLCDQMLAFLLVSSSSSAATASELSRHGLHSIWPPACSTWKLSLFCSRADVAVAMSFVACLFTFLSTFSSGYLLANLLAE